MKKPKKPQKLEEELCDAIENFGLYADQIADLSYTKGYYEGAKKMMKLMKNGADYDDLTGELEELKKECGY